MRGFPSYLKNCQIFSLWRRQYPKPTLSQSHQYSTANTVKTTRVSKHLILNETAEKSNHPKRPLVLLFDWLYAKPSQLKKYASLYHDKGLDVLTVSGRVAHFLWPPNGYKLADEIFEYLYTKRDVNEPLFIHAFSIGAFNFTICLKEADRLSKKYGGDHFRNRVIGQVFDSIVIGTYDNMTEGMVTLLPNMMFKKGIIPLVDLYYRVTSKKTKDEYDRLVAHFKDEPIHVPTIFFYSENDPMCHIPTMEAMLDTWYKDKPHFDVKAKSWKISQHTAHLKNHPDEYLKEWNALINKVL